MIGVLSQPIIKAYFNTPEFENATSYILSSYIKWINSAGAKAVPLNYFDNWENVT
jgi:hypothetical protein